MTERRPPFLTARWRHVALVSYEVEPRLLAPLVPAGCELDCWRERPLVSLVGFLFLDTRVLGIAVPGHRDFEEVNLRFYVRRRMPAGWRRGVVFVKEIVPRRAIAWTARAVYGENYVALPMSHSIDGGEGGDEAAAPARVRYAWRCRGRESSLELAGQGTAREAEPGSDAELVAEHAWGYARRRGGRTVEYEVVHPRWKIRRATARVECDVAGLYGERFVEALSAPPASAWLADGSAVTVHRGAPLARAEAG
jgi:uncharacterized protein YqjF (DUF2071 family)